MNQAEVIAVPASPIDQFIPGELPPQDLDPLKDGILMAHQSAWLADPADVKVAEKGRRTGITFSEALDATLLAAAKRSAGGTNYWYIGDTKEKGLEFIATASRFAKSVAAELVKIEEFVFEDKQDDGSSKFISAYRVRFASGFQVAALASTPATIRGLQGVVCIDEAAFHANVGAVLDACLALLIWGGKIRIISTHNGVANAFNELIKQVREGRYPSFSLHRITFDDAVSNGLYERVCLIKGEKPTPEGKRDWYQRIRQSYGPRIQAMKEELDAVPREGGGVAIPLAWIEDCSTADYVVKRWTPPAEGFVDWPETRRRGEMLAWLEEHVGPILRELPQRRTALGEDFGMRVDRSSLVVGYTAEDLKRHVPLIVELWRCPYDQQKQALFYILDRLKGFQKGVLDANGNGMALAQEARQHYGSEAIEELMPSANWYREFSPKFHAAFSDRTILIPADADVRDDVHQFREIDGVIKIPSEVRTTGKDDRQRHADSGAALLNFYAATLGGWTSIDFQSVPGPGRPADRAYQDGPAGPRELTSTGWGTVAGDIDTRGY